MTSVIVGVNGKMLNLVPCRNERLTFFFKLLILVFHFIHFINTSFTPKLKSSFRHLKRGIQNSHMDFVLLPADKAANNVVDV